MQPAVVSRLSRAFPRRLAKDAKAALGSLPDSDHDPVGSIGRVQLRDETLDIPHRVYMPEPNSLAPIADDAQVLTACIYTRHYDGVVRERNLRRILPSQAEWVPPFIVQLAGEYVIEILEVLADHLGHLKGEAYRQFTAQNPEFMAVTRQRMISYWDCYYRKRYPRLADYVGLRVVDVLSGRKSEEPGGGAEAVQQ
jgi:hypothetical protein